MGSNVKIDEYSATPIDIIKLDRVWVVQDFKQFFDEISDEVYRTRPPFALFGRNNLALYNNTAFAGSSKLLVNMQISTDLLVNTYRKRRFGDIDIMVPHEAVEKDGVLEEILQPGKTYGRYTVLGTKRIGTQLHCLARHVNSGEIHQIDFEGATYEKDTPSRWNQLSTNSHPEDMMAGLKGVHHKLLLNAAIKATHTVWGIHVLKNGKVKSRGKHPKYTFAVSHGVRTSYEDTGKMVCDPECQLIEKTLYPELKKIGPKDSPLYITHVPTISNLLFGRPEEPIDSFCGIIRSAMKYWPIDQKQLMYDYYCDNIKRTDPESKESRKSFLLLEDMLEDSYV